MSLELLNTFGTLTTVAIIAATAIAALIQLRHLRASNQINAMLSIGNQFADKEFRDGMFLVLQKLGPAMSEPAYRSYVVSVMRSQAAQTVTQEHRDIIDAARLVGNAYEELGILVKNGIVDKNIFLDRYCLVILRIWRCMEPVVAWTREVAGNNAVWENFEYLAVLSEDFINNSASNYPKGVRRLQLHNPWPVPQPT